jgi:hypothetical protein
VQPIYTATPQFATLAGDPIKQRCGFIEGTSERLAVPDNLQQQVRWARAEGSGPLVWADNPDQRSAIAAIGTPLPGKDQGTIYPHLVAVVRHLVRENPRPETVSVEAHVDTLNAAFTRLINRHIGQIAANLLRHRRSKTELFNYLRADVGQEADRRRQVTQLWQRAVEVAATAADGEVVVIGVPRHGLGEEQIAALGREHPRSGRRLAIWRGREAEDPLQRGRRMCWRHDEAHTLQQLKLNVDQGLCRQGDLRCPYFDRCGYQRQQRPADIWLMAHESLTHAKPDVIGRVKELLIDEDPLDALLWFDTIKLKDFAQQARVNSANDVTLALRVTNSRQRLANTLAHLDDGPVPKDILQEFDRRLGMERQIAGEWAQKIEPDIKPTMTERQVQAAATRAAANALIEKRIKLWATIKLAIAEDAPDLCGRLQLATDDDGGRVVRMCGVQPINAAFGTPIGVADASADPQVLKHIWPQLEAGRMLFPRMDHARFRQLVNRSFSKDSIAVARQDVDTASDG